MLLMHFTASCLVHCYLNGFYRYLHSHNAVCDDSGASPLRGTAQLSSPHIQICQRTQHERCVSIPFRTTAVSDLAKVKDALGCRNDILDFHADPRAGAATHFAYLDERQIAWYFSVGKILGTGHYAVHHSLLSGVGNITSHLRLIPMQQIYQYSRIVHIGCRRVNLLAPVIRADMSLHAKIPLAALLFRSHLRGARHVLVRDRTGRTDETGIQVRAAGNQQALLPQILNYCLKQRFTQFISLHQVIEVEDRSPNRCRRPARIETGKAVIGAGLTQRIIHIGVGQAEPVLEEISEQHPPRSCWIAPVTGLGRAGFNQCTRLSTWHHMTLFGQKLVSVRRRVVVALKIIGGEGLPSNRLLSVVNNVCIIADVRT